MRLLVTASNELPEARPDAIGLTTICTIDGFMATSVAMVPLSSRQASGTGQKG